MDTPGFMRESNRVAAGCAKVRTRKMELDDVPFSFSKGYWVNIHPIVAAASVESRTKHRTPNDLPSRGKSSRQGEAFCTQENSKRFFRRSLVRGAKSALVGRTHPERFGVELIFAQ